MINRCTRAVVLAIVLFLAAGMSACTGQAATGGPAQPPAGTAPSIGGPPAPTADVGGSSSTGPSPSSSTGPTATGSVTDKSGAPAGSPPAGCTMVSAAAASTALGVQLVDTSVPATGLCTFDSADHVKGLGLFTYTDSVSLKSMLSTGIHLPGLGDDASWFPTGVIVVSKGSRGFSLTATGFDITDPAVTQTLQAALVALARTVAVKF